MRKWWIIPLIIVGSIYLVASATISSIKAFHQTQVEQEAKRLLGQAEQDARPTWTEENAESWLRQHGFEQVLRLEGLSSGAKESEHFFAVRGYKVFEKGGVIVQPTSICVQFYFDLRHQFLRVKSNVWPMEPPETPDPEIPNDPAKTASHSDLPPSEILSPSPK